MEIKIHCPCGTRFKFDVEPIHGRMPAPVSCPECGADATEQANTIIQSSQPQAQARAAIPTAVLLPGSGGPLRVTAPSIAAPPPAPPAPTHIPPPIPALPAGRSTAAKSPVVKILTAVLLIACVGFGAWRVGAKWFRRLNLLAQVASAVGEAGVDKEDSLGAKNLTYDDCAILFIRHSNHLEVAEACKAFWKEKLHKNMALINSPQDAENQGEYELLAAHNGYVRMIGTYDWQVAQLEDVAQALSQKFGTLVFSWRSEHVADTYQFGVFDQGTKKFHAQMDVKITREDAVEKVTTEGDDFALASGFKPGPDGFKDFNVLEADKITQLLGMKLWDEKEGAEVKAALLKEEGQAVPAAQTQPVSQRAQKR